MQLSADVHLHTPTLLKKFMSDMRQVCQLLCTILNDVHASVCTCTYTSTCVSLHVCEYAGVEVGVSNPPVDYLIHVAGQVDG